MTREMQEFVSEAAPIMKRLWWEYRLSYDCQLCSLNILGRRYEKGQLSLDTESGCRLAIFIALQEYPVTCVRGK